jgi:hypothetical protein
VSTFALQATLLVVAGLLLGSLVAWLTRRQAITFRYTLAWSVIAGLALLAVPLVPIVEPVASSFALSPSALLTVVVALILGVIALQLSVSASRLGQRLDDLAIAQALSSARLGPISARPGSGTLVIVPAYNEERTVGHVVASIRSLGHDVVVIDDGSTDGTAEIVAKEGGALLQLPTNLGVGAALRTGLRYACQHGYRCVVQCDADGQHPPESIDLLLEERERTGMDLLIGSRFIHPGTAKPPLPRRFAMWVLARSASNAAEVRVSDATSGFRVIARPLMQELARAMPNHYLGDTYEVVVAAGRAGYRIGEVGVEMLDRRHGKSSASTVAATTFTVRALAVVALRAQPSLWPATPDGRR